MAFHNLQFRINDCVIQCCGYLTYTAGNVFFHFAVVVYGSVFVTALIGLRAQFHIGGECFSRRQYRAVDIVTAHFQIGISVFVTHGISGLERANQVCYMAVCLCCDLRFFHFRLNFGSAAHTGIQNSSRIGFCFSLIHHTTGFFRRYHKSSVFPADSTVYGMTVEFSSDFCQFRFHFFCVIRIFQRNINTVFQQLRPYLKTFFVRAFSAGVVGLFHGFFQMVTSAKVCKRHLPFCFLIKPECEHLPIDFCHILFFQCCQCFFLAHAFQRNAVYGHALINAFCRKEFQHLMSVIKIISQNTCQNHQNHYQCPDHYFLFMRLMTGFPPVAFYTLLQINPQLSITVVFAFPQ